MDGARPDGTGDVFLLGADGEVTTAVAVEVGADPAVGHDGRRGSGRLQNGSHSEHGRHRSRPEQRRDPHRTSVARTVAGPLHNAVRAVRGVEVMDRPD
jgi:hypothetical protein